MFGKLVERQGRKAESLRCEHYDSLAAKMCPEFALCIKSGRFFIILSNNALFLLDL